MSVSPLNDLLLQALSPQSAGASATSGSSSATGNLLNSADFGKLLELQMNQSSLGLAGLGTGEDEGSTGAGDSYASLMGLASGNSGTSGTSLESMMLLKLMETVVDRLSVLEQQVAPAAASVTAAAPTAASAAAADPIGIAPAAATPSP